MQSEEFDHKIREAADHHHPAYDEKAWENMKKLLDKHLPQEKDGRRRIIFFLFFFLLIGGGAWLLISKPWKENKQEAQVQQSAAPSVQQTLPDAQSEPGTSAKGSKTTGSVIDIQNKGEEDRKNSGPITPVQIPDKNLPQDILSKQQQTTTTAATGNTKINRQQIVSDISKKVRPDNRIVINSRHDKNTPDQVKVKNTGKPAAEINDKIKPDNSIVISSGQDKSTVDPVKMNTVSPATDINPSNKKDEPVAGKDNLSVAGTTGQKVDKSDGIEVENKDTAAVTQESVVKKTKSKKNKRSSFFVTLSAGPDISFAGAGSTGKIKLLAGGGLGYTVKDRLTVRTGFYTGRKVYSAAPGDYHPPSDFWRYYPNLEKVDADCKVYEIPLSFSYNFGNSSKHNWFASAGLSSYLMKKETYNYFYKVTPTSPTIQRKWTLLDQNKHYFSVLTLSAGYQKNIGRAASIMIEPYFKLPLGGVGYGKVKLNSAGVLFSVGIKPFTAKKNSGKLRH
jgi:hypothetical protein